MTAPALSQLIQDAIVGAPGRTTRQIAAAVGKSDPTGMARVSTLLSQLRVRGKVRTDVQMGKLHHFPTALTGVDLRSIRASTDPRLAAQAQAKRDQRASRAAREAKGAPAVARLVKANTPPKPAASVRVIPKREPLPPPAVRAAPAETVADFLARGGVIQRLGPYECSNPLRFDHGDPDIPATKRRAITRARPHRTHA